MAQRGPGNPTPRPRPRPRPGGPGSPRCCWPRRTRRWAWASAAGSPGPWLRRGARAPPRPRATVAAAATGPGPGPPRAARGRPGRAGPGPPLALGVHRPHPRLPRRRAPGPLSGPSGVGGAGGRGGAARVRGAASWLVTSRAPLLGESRRPARSAGQGGETEVWGPCSQHCAEGGRCGEQEIKDPRPRTLPAPCLGGNSFASPPLHLFMTFLLSP